MIEEERPFDEGKLRREYDRLISVACKEDDKIAVNQAKLRQLLIQVDTLEIMIENAEKHRDDALEEADLFAELLEEHFPTSEQLEARQQREREAADLAELEAFANEIVLMPAGPQFHEGDWEWKNAIEGATIEVLQIDLESYEEDLAERNRLLERQTRDRRAKNYENAIARPKRDFRYIGAKERDEYNAEMELNKAAWEERQQELGLPTDEPKPVLATNDHDYEFTERMITA